MENQTPTFKQIKVTHYTGVVNYVPLNKDNWDFYNKKRDLLSPQKKEKSSVEKVELSLDEAIKLGISEAIFIKNPPKKKTDQNAELLSALVEQNKMLMQLLTEKQEAKTKK